jgi:hypothetical protein
MKWFAWFAFAATNLATIYVDRYLWYLANHFSILQLLAIASVALGIWALYLLQNRLLGLIPFFIILGIGQLSLIQYLAVYLIWSINGFASWSACRDRPVGRISDSVIRPYSAEMANYAAAFHRVALDADPVGSIRPAGYGLSAGRFAAARITTVMRREEGLEVDIPALRPAGPAALWSRDRWAPGPTCGPAPVSVQIPCGRYGSFRCSCQSNGGTSKMFTDSFTRR